MQVKTPCVPSLRWRSEIERSARAGVGEDQSGLVYQYITEMIRRPHMVSRERGFAGTLLRHWGVTRETTVDAVLIALSELLSNAVLYGKADAIVLSLSYSRNEVLVEVDDRTPGTWPARARPTEHDEGGRGLLLVEALSSAFDVSDDGSMAWCVIPAGQVT